MHSGTRTGPTCRVPFVLQSAPSLHRTHGGLLVTGQSGQAMRSYPHLPTPQLTILCHLRLYAECLPPTTDHVEMVLFFLLLRPVFRFPSELNLYASETWWQERSGKDEEGVSSVLV